MTDHPNIDVLVITALQDERDGVLAVDRDSPETGWTKAEDVAGFRIDHRVFVTLSGSSFRVAVARTQSMGPAGAAATASRLVSDLKPRFLAMCGVCAGRPGKTFLGDIIAADRLYTADAGKIVARSSIDRELFREIATYNLDPLWKERIEDTAADWAMAYSLLRPVSLLQQSDSFLRKLLASEESCIAMPLSSIDPTECPDRALTLARLRRKGLVTEQNIQLTTEGRTEARRLYDESDVCKKDPGFQVRVGPIATVVNVTEDSNAFEHLARQQRAVLALDMEGSAVGFVAELGRVRLLVAKAVQDWADDDKDDRYRIFAARVSAEFVIDFFRWAIDRETSVSPVTRNAASSRSDLEIRDLARKLLEDGTPPSLVPLFAEAPTQVATAIAELQRQVRRVRAQPTRDSEVRADKHTTVTIDELARRECGRHLVVAPRGAGKSFALWHAAEAMLTDSSAIPIFLPLGRFANWRDVIDHLQRFTSDPETLLRDGRVIVFLDGWSEFGGGAGGDSSAHRMVLSAVGSGRIVASARHGAEHDARFEIAELDPLPGDAVRRVLGMAFPDAPPPAATLLELFRLPLALVLHLLLGGPAASRGELLAELQRQLSAGSPADLTAALARAAARTALSSTTRRRGVFEAELRRAGAELGVSEPMELVKRLGTLGSNSADVRPVHDLYWSWLVGVGVLETSLVTLAQTRLQLRESIDLAIESGTRVAPTLVEETRAVDVELATRLAWAVSGESNAALIHQLKRMLADDRAAVRRRAVLAGMQSSDSIVFRKALEVLSQLRSDGLHFSELDGQLRIDALWQQRSELAAWAGANGTNLVLDAIALQGDSRWVEWLARIVSAGKIAGDIAGAVAIACSQTIPAWVRPFLGSIGEQAWLLRNSAARGANLELARWVAEEYERLCARQPRSSRWIHLNRVLAQCGDDGVFESLLNRFEGMSIATQETICYAVVERGEPWISEFQRRAFAVGAAGHHHRLLEQVSSLIDDTTARAWIEKEPAVLGWQVLIKRHGNAIVPELIAHLPESFSDLHHIPPLRAMASLDNPPDGLVDEIWKRVRGTMMPAAMDDVIKALARVRLKGIPTLIALQRGNLNFLPNIGFNRFLMLHARWEAETGFRVRASDGVVDRPFSEWIRLARWEKDRDDPLVGHFLHRSGLPVSDDVLDAWAAGEPTLGKFVAISGPLDRYHEGAVSMLLTRATGLTEVLKLFGGVLARFPESALLALLANATTPDGYRELLNAVSASNDSIYREFHAALIHSFLKQSSLDTHASHSLASILRVHSASVLRELLSGAIDTPNGLWLVRDVEVFIGIILVNEDGHWLEGASGVERN